MIARTLLRLDQRYPTRQERSAILAYVASAPRRLAALEEARAKEAMIVEETIAQVKQRFPNFPGTHPMGWEKCYRDVSLAHAFAVNAMFLGETDTLDETFGYWVRSMLKSVKFTPQLAQETYGMWREALARHLSAEAFQLMLPIADHLIRRISDIPEPFRAEVGARVAPAAP